MRKPLAIIGMSPGNSYFKDFEVRFLLQESIERFGCCAVMVADVPAIATYLALGYAPNRARNKAIPKGNNLKNRTRRLAESLGYTEDQVRIIDWAEEVEPHPAYRRHFERVMEKYHGLPAFAEEVRATSGEVLGHAGGRQPDTDPGLDAGVEQATHYLLSEIAFLEFAPEFFGSERVCYLYHRNWQIYEDYIRGRHDGVPKPHLDFLLLEAPYETYEKLHGAETGAGDMLHDTYSRVMRSGVLRAAFTEYPPVFQRTGSRFSGIFYELIEGFAALHQLKIEWVEETGYGVVTNGLAEGRFDVFGSAVWPTHDRHTKAALSRPLYFSEVGVWVKAESHLAEKDWIALNDPQYHIALTEGDITHEICLTDFTFAKWVRAPQLGRVKALFDFVAEGRADATLAEQITYDAYAPGLAQPLVNIAKEKPIRRYPNCFLVGKNQNDFLEVLNDYIADVLKTGKAQDVLRRYAGPEHKGIYFR